MNADARRLPAFEKFSQLRAEEQVMPWPRDEIIDAAGRAMRHAAGRTVDDAAVAICEAEIARQEHLHGNPS